MKKIRRQGLRAGTRRVALDGYVAPSATPFVLTPDSGWNAIGPYVERELRKAEDEETNAGDRRRAGSAFREEADAINVDERRIRDEMEAAIARRLGRRA